MKPLIIISILFLLCACNNKPAGNGNQGNIDTAISTTSSSPSAYEGLRTLALETSSGALGLDLPADKVSVYGVVMDWELGGKVVTISAYQNGEASMYMSEGGGVLGAGKETEVKKAAKSLVNLAQAYQAKATPAGILGMPGKDSVQFCLLTNKGSYLILEDMKNFENASSPFFALFNEANILIELIRESGEKSGNLKIKGDTLIRR